MSCHRTFHHSSGGVIDLTVGITTTNSNTETIGRTSNHPFWSVDRQKYIQAGDLKVGETLKSFKDGGDQKVVIGQIPRPDATPVYNLEVHGEHVYYVGQNGVLVHNTYESVTKGTFDDQVEALAQNVEGLSPRQARFILDKAFNGQNKTSVTVGGSRFKLNNRVPRADSDIGFGNLSENQAVRIVRKIRKNAEKKNSGLIPKGQIQIVPGKSTKTISVTEDPIEFFQRSGTRSLDDILHPGKDFGPSGSITVSPSGEIRIVNP